MNGCFKEVWCDVASMTYKKKWGLQLSVNGIPNKWNKASQTKTKNIYPKEVFISSQILISKMKDF